VHAVKVAPEGGAGAQRVAGKNYRQ